MQKKGGVSIMIRNNLRVDRRMFLKVASAVGAVNQTGFAQGKEGKQPEDGDSQAGVRIETTEWGSCLPDKPYFPMYLANGVDAMLINLLGSGDTTFEGQYDYGVVLSGLRSPGWAKCDRRARGILFPLFEFASSPVLNGDVAVPRKCKQYFDPRQATLTTFYEQKDIETEEWMRVKVTTFLTREHMLVERYEFLETPASGAAIRFFLHSPSDAYFKIYARVVKMDAASLQVDAKHSLMNYEYTLEKYRGGARSWLDCESATGKATEKKEEVFVDGQLQSRLMHTGESFTRYLVAIDNEDAGDYRAALEAALAECRELGYQRLRDRHQKEWQDYFAASRIEIPDAAVAYTYNVGPLPYPRQSAPVGFHAQRPAAVPVGRRDVLGHWLRRRGVAWLRKHAGSRQGAGTFGDLHGGCAQAGAAFRHAGRAAGLDGRGEEVQTNTP